MTFYLCAFKNTYLGCLRSNTYYVLVVFAMLLLSFLLTQGIIRIAKGRGSSWLLPNSFISRLEYKDNFPFWEDMWINQLKV